MVLPGVDEAPARYVSRRDTPCAAVAHRYKTAGKRGWKLHFTAQKPHRTPSKWLQHGAHSLPHAP